MNGPAEGTEGTLSESAVLEHLLHDGEIVELAIKPSGWFVLLTSASMLVALMMVAVAAHYVDAAFGIALGRQAVYAFCTALGVIRLMVAGFQWMGTLYVLTNRRVLAIRAGLRISITGCQLKEIKDVSVTHGTGERLFGVGTVAFETLRGALQGGHWLCVAKPQEVAQAVREAISRIS